MAIRRILPPISLLMWLVLLAFSSFLGSRLDAQSGDQNDPETQPAVPTVETWIGWVDAPTQSLRAIIRVERENGAKPASAVFLSPDQSTTAIPLSELKVESNGAWAFSLMHPVTAVLSATYAGKEVSPGIVEGQLSQEDQKLTLNLRRVEALPAETPETLGADSVWTGTLDAVVNKSNLRMRVYSKPPYASEEQPRVLFDSPTVNAVGIPATVTIEPNRRTIFEIKSIGAKFSAILNDNADELIGTFLRGPVPIPLTLKLVKPNADNQKPELATNEDKPPQPTSPTTPSTTPPPPKSRVIASNEFFTESEFEVMHSVPPVKKKAPVTPANPGIKISGIITMPRAPKQKVPAVVMLSDIGPNDKNGTVGKHKTLEVLAHYLAENGVASLRYDDRGVGQSTGTFLASTADDFAKDALAVWKYARNQPDIDPSRIGILGQSEGGIVGPMVALWEPQVAFMILLSPTGVAGTEVLRSQIDRMAELQGVSREDRDGTLQLQAELQALASGYISDPVTMQREMKATIDSHWGKLKAMLLAQDPSADTEKVKVSLTEQIQAQLEQLRMPWYRFFLSYDPATNWMLVRCPTLALWGSNDLQVLPELNRSKIVDAVKRNTEADVTLEILEDLNHLLQTSKTGLPDEYEEIDETISPKALSTIRIWAQAKGLMDR